MRLRHQGRTSPRPGSPRTRAIGAGVVTAVVVLVAVGLATLHPWQHNRTASLNATGPTTIVGQMSASSTYDRYAAPFRRAVEQWNKAWTEIDQTTAHSGVIPTSVQVSAVETPLLIAAHRFLAELERMSVRPHIQGDLRHEIGDLSAFIGDETEVNALWPASEPVTLRGKTDLARLTPPLWCSARTFTSRRRLSRNAKPQVACGP